ncbi:MAG: Gfo/Idh/MocA family oxidoreductase [Clostridia bacterium]|nr:Gfo/Idh/MocA family oxidoreductase [Clostridia bacterium]
MAVKWCVIGAGGIADRRMIPALKSDLDNQVVALMDRKVEVAKRLGKKYGVKYYTDEETMLKETECDAVYIGTPVYRHYSQAMLALKYGRHVFIEKPLGLNAKESEEILKAFKNAGKQLTVGYMMKHHNLHERAKAMVKRGDIGAVSSIRLQFSCWYPKIDGAWRQVKSLGGGGALMDLGVHCIELAEYVLGEEIKAVKGLISKKTFDYEVEDSAVLAFKTLSGALGHIDVNFNIPDDASESKLEIYGDKGYIICKGTLGQEEKGKMLYLYSPQGDYVAAQNRTAGKPKIYYGNKGNLYLKQVKKFNSIINGGAPDYSFAEKAVAVQKIVDEIYAQNGVE